MTAFGHTCWTWGGRCIFIVLMATSSRFHLVHLRGLADTLKIIASLSCLVQTVSMAWAWTHLACWHLLPSVAASTVDVAGDSGLWQNGEWWMLLAAQSMALGTIMVQWVTKKDRPCGCSGVRPVLLESPPWAL